MNLSDVKTMASKVHKNISSVIVGKDDVIDLILTTCIAGGNLLLEDVPGTGKTMLAKCLAKSLDSDFNRIQFTPDLLPSDITGLYFYNQKESEFTFRKGPVFCNILLADEINRATPRTQSALLECMEEKQITIDSITHPLNRPFFVIATQNSIETAGTFPLPEAQMDRFMMQLSLGHPSFEDEVNILNRFIKQSPFQALAPVLSQNELVKMQDLITEVFVHPVVMNYIVSIIQATRTNQDVSLGVSPRGSIAFLRACQSYAALQGMTYVTPDIVKYLAPFALSHRLVLRSSYQKTSSAKSILAEILAHVPVPTEDFTH